MFVVIRLGEYRDGEVIAPDHIALTRRPSVIQPTMAAAEKEAERLSRLNPGEVFGVFALSTLVRTKLAPTESMPIGYTDRDSCVSPVY